MPTDLQTLIAGLRCVFHNRLVDRQCCHRLFAGQLSLAAAMVSETRTGRDEAADDDIFLETTEFVALAHDGSLGENPRRFLEGSRRNERIGGQRCLGDTQQHVIEIGRDLALGDSPVIFCQQLGALHLFGLDELRITRFGDGNTTQHLTDNYFNMLIVDLHTLQTINVLDFVSDVAGQGLDTLQTQDIVRIWLALDDLFTLVDDLTIVNQNMFVLGNQIFMGSTVKIGNDQTLLAFRILTESDGTRVLRQD